MTDEQLIQLFSKQAIAQNKSLDTNKLMHLLKQRRHTAKVPETQFSPNNTNAVNQTVNTTQETPKKKPLIPVIEPQKEVSSYKKGGSISKFDMFTGYLLEKSGAQNEQDLQTWIKQQGQNQMKQHYADFESLLNSEKTQTMKNGAKLDYIKQLKGICPEGYEVSYFEQGGSVVKKCKKCEEKGGALPYRPISAEKGTKTIQGIKQDMKDKKKQTEQNDSTYTKAHYDKDVKDFRDNGYKFKDKAHQDRVQKWNRKNPTELEKHACGGKKKLAKRK